MASLDSDSSAAVEALVAGIPQVGQLCHDHLSNNSMEINRLDTPAPSHEVDTGVLCPTKVLDSIFWTCLARAGA